MLLGTLLTLVFILYAQGTIKWAVFNHLENLAYDLRLRLTTPGGEDDRIVIIDIDEESLAVEGRWPWPRDRIAHLIDLLFDQHKIGILGMDVVWAEPDESSGLKVLDQLANDQLSDNVPYQQTLETIRPGLQRDRIFAESLKDRPIILGYYFDLDVEEGKGNITGKLPRPAFTRHNFKGKTVDFIEAGGYGANLPDVQDAALDAGHFNPDPDIDGIVRRIPMLVQYGDAQYASLSMAITQHLLGVEQIGAGFAEGLGAIRSYYGLEWLTLADRRIPVDQHARALIPFRGGKGSFPYVSASDVLEGRVTMNLQGAIALLGASAPGLLDLRATPIQSSYPGVEMHANMIAGIIDRNIKESPAWKLGAEVTMMAVIGLLMALLLPLLSPVKSTLLTVAIASLTVTLNLYLWNSVNLVLPIAAILLLILGLYILDVSYGYFIESRGKRELAGIFGQYIPTELVDEMSLDPSSYSLQGESREMTVFFSDVRGFTTISESLKPDELQHLMNEFLTPITEIIHKHRGTIDKYIGDAVMAFWGAPLNDPEHARHALHAAVEILQTLKDLQPVFMERGWPPLRIGVGLNTGIMHVGDMGSRFRRSYTVMGDAVNLGSRLEGLTKQYGVDMIVSEYTRAAVPEFAFRELDRVMVKGKDQAVAIFEPLGLADTLSKEKQDELALYEQALKYYRQQNWDLSELQFINLSQQHPTELLYRTYMERIAHYRKEPPGDDWDGAYRFTTK